MLAYIIRRLLLIIPTLWVILTINFFIIQTAPGGPVEQAMAEAMGFEDSMLDRVTNANQGDVTAASSPNQDSGYRGGRGLDPEVIAEIEARFGFDKPMSERYWTMIGDYLTFNFGESLFKSGEVIDLLIERLPVSISLGLWSTLLIYLISIPLGIRKALKNGHTFDRWTSTVLSLAYAIPSFLLAILLIILFASGTFLDWFPLRGLTSDGWEDMNWWEKTVDYAWHMALPVAAMTVGGFATLTMLTKNSFLDEISKQYVITARAKGLANREVLYGHVFRNAMLLIIASFPAAFLSIFLTGSVLIEAIFSLEGIGLLGYEAILQRDYPVVFSTLYIFTLLSLIIALISDLTYTVVDPRIDFEGR